MDEQKLAQFANDSYMKEAVFAYIKSSIDEDLLANAYAGLDISGAKMANELITNVFSKMTNEFSPKPTNQSNRNSTR